MKIFIKLCNLYHWQRQSTDLYRTQLFGARPKFWGAPRMTWLIERGALRSSLLYGMEQHDTKYLIIYFFLENQCSGYGSGAGSVRFWASRIRIRWSEIRIGILNHKAKIVRNPLILLFCDFFMTFYQHCWKNCLYRQKIPGRFQFLSSYSMLRLFKYSYSI